MQMQQNPADGKPLDFAMKPSFHSKKELTQPSKNDTVTGAS